MFPNFEMGSLFLKKDFNLPEIPPLDLSNFPDYAQGINFPLSINEDFEFETTIDVPTLRYKTGRDLSECDRYLHKAVKYEKWCDRLDDIIYSLEDLA